MKLKHCSFALLLMLLFVNLVRADYPVKKLPPRSLSTHLLPGKPLNIKCNVMALAFQNVSLFGEYAFLYKFSAQLGVRFMLPNGPGLFNFNSISVGGIDGLRLGGYAITPEIRFYPGKHLTAPAPHGFYIGLYGRYSVFNLKFNYDIRAVTNNTVFDPVVENNFKLNQLGAGLIIGKQWAVLGFTVDWFILAGGPGVATLSYEMRHPSLVDPVIGNQVNNDLVDNFTNFKVGSLFQTKYNPLEGSIKMSATGAAPNIRSIFLGGLCLGYHF